MAGFPGARVRTARGRPPPPRRGACKASAAVVWRSLHVLGGVRGAVILLVGDEGGQAAELDVAKAAVPAVGEQRQWRRRRGGVRSAQRRNARSFREGVLVGPN